MQPHGPSAPDKGISWQQTSGKLLNPYAKLLSDVNTFPDCVRNGPFLVQLQLLPKVYSLETHYYGRVSVKIRVAVRLFCTHTVKLLSRPLSTLFIFVSFQLIYNAGLFIRTGIGPGPRAFDESYNNPECTC